MFCCYSYYEWDWLFSIKTHHITFELIRVWWSFMEGRGILSTPHFAVVAKNIYHGETMIYYQWKLYLKCLYPLRLGMKTSCGTQSHCSVPGPSSSYVTCTYKWSFRSFAAFCTLLWDTLLWLQSSLSDSLGQSERVWEILSTSSLNTKVYIRILFVLHTSSVREVVHHMNNANLFGIKESKNRSVNSFMQDRSELDARWYSTMDTCCKKKTWLLFNRWQMTAVSVTKSCDLPGFCAGAVSLSLSLVRAHTCTHTQNTYFMNPVELHWIMADSALLFDHSVI